MANVAKLKKKAAEFELKRQFDKALAVYVEILDNFDQHPEEVDVALFNRVGDMLLRQGNVADAVDYYERAVDRYAEGGFFNNAIALCNKILRQSPGRSSIYYKLGKISAQKGFKNDAKQNFLEYADRMQKSGRMDEAFRALKEFADLCPDQDDIRLMLAEQLSRQERAGEAIEQLQTLVERYSDEGRDVEARATLDRIMAIDPDYKPRQTGPQKAQKTSDIVFLDVYAMGDDAPPAKAAPPAKRQPPPAPPAARPAAPPAAPPVPVAEVPPAPAEIDVHLDLDGASIIGGLESTSLQGEADDPAGSMLDLEPTAFGSGSIDAVPDAPSSGFALDGLEVTSFGSDTSADEPPGFTLDVTGDTDDFAVDTADESAAEGEPSEVASGELDFLIPPADDELEVEEESATTPDLQFFVPDIEDTALAEPEFSTPDASGAPAIEEGFTIDLGGFDVDAGAVVEPGSAASVPEVSIDDALGALPFMEDVEPTVPAAGPTASFDLDVSEADETGSPAPSEPAPPPASKPIPKVGRFSAKPKVAAPEAAAPAPAAAAPQAPAPPADTPPAEPPPAEAAPGKPADRTRRSTIAAEHSVELLETLADTDPEDFSLRRRLAETRLESGDREGGLADLEAAMLGFERAENLADAASVADEIARITPDSVRIHQKRVEYAFRTNERMRLVSAYLDLAAALLGDGQTDKARTVYKRVLDLAPDDIAAQAGLSALTAEAELAAPEPAADAPPLVAESQPSAAAASPSARDIAPPASPRSAAPAAPAAPADDDSFINLGDWLRDDAGPKNTRMVVEEKEPTGDEEADFAEMLRRFKQGVAENVDAEDHQSHYDLGVAFKEMGLIDEAISEFQRALRAPTNRLPTYEALGQCFVEKGQHQVAKAILARALSEPDVSDEQLIGVLYLLGHASESVGQHQDALTYYQRVFVVDIQFRDVAERLTAVEQAAR